jgi:hypothetical protein
MTDHDEAIARHYREMAREEPPAALDAAILAASRRAAAPRPRWMLPVSIAAVLALGIGVALRMQVEQPGIETSAPPPAAPSEYALPQASEAPAVAAPARKAVKPPDLPPEAAPQQAPAPLADRAEPQARGQAAITMTAPAAVAPPPAPAAPGVVAPPSAPAAAASVPTELRARRAEAQERAAPKDAREAELERIAKLRAAGRHDEADTALEAFRREHPQYRIPDALRERVERR